MLLFNYFECAVKPSPIICQHMNFKVVTFRHKLQIGNDLLNTLDGV